MIPSNTPALVLASAALNQASNPIDTKQVVAMSAIAVVTGTSTGALNIEVSNDQPNGVDSNGLPIVTNWILAPTQTVSISGAGVYIIPMFEFCYRWARAQFVAGNAASGTITVNIKTNGF